MHYIRNRRHGNPLITKHHKQSQSKSYRRWNSMRQRCENPNDWAYAHYGGRGIKVCDRWKNSYFDYLSDVGEPPSSRHSLDRIDNDGNYEPKNTRWVLQDVQAHNQRVRSKTGFKGVYEFRGKYRASLMRGKSKIYLGTFLTPELANQAYLKAEAKLYGN